MAAAEFLRLDERKAVRTTIDAKAGPEGGGGQTVVVTLDGIPDDSVRTERWTLGFEEAGDGVLRAHGRAPRAALPRRTRAPGLRGRSLPLSETGSMLTQANEAASEKRAFRPCASGRTRDRRP